MPKLYLEENFIEKNMMPKMQKAITNLVKAINRMDCLIIPNDFEYSDFLKTLSDKNYNCLKELREKKDSIEKKVENFKKIEKENLENYNEVEFLNIPLRNSLKK